MSSAVVRRSVLRISLILGILFLAVCTFSPLLSAGFLMLDDSYLITQNPIVARPSLAMALRAFRSYDPELYIPMTLLSYQLDRIVGDFSPLMFHLHNVLLHLGSAGLVFWLLLLLTRSRSVAGFTALVFLFHPVQTEAVAWLSARKDLLSSFFVLASLVAYLSHRSLHGTKRRDVYTLSIVLFFIALLSKVSVAVLPLLLLLIDDPRPKSRGIPQEHIPYWILGIVFAVIGFFGKTASLGHISPAVTVFIACRSFFFMLSSLVFPAHLQPLSLYSAWAEPSFIAFLSAFCVLGFFVATLVLLRKKSVFGRLMMMFVILCIPVGITFWKDGIVYFPSDRYVYLAIVPFVLTILLSLQYLLYRFHVVRFAWIRQLCAVVLILFCALLTFRQAHIWQSDASLFSHVLAIDPESHVARSNLGNVARARGDLFSAIDDYKKAIMLKPDFAVAYRNAGSALLASNDFVSATQYYRHSIALSPENSAGYYGLGVVQLQRKQFAQAERAFLRAIDLSPTFIDAYIGLGSVYYAQHDAEKERALYERGLVVNPNDPSLRQNLSVVLHEKK